MTAAFRRLSTDHPRLRLAAAGGSLALVLALSGCGTDGDGGPPPEDSTTPAPASSTPVTSPSAPDSSASSPSDAGPSSSRDEDGEGSDDPLDLPSAELERSTYEGEPRPIEDVYVMACLEALANGEPIPAMEAREGDHEEPYITPWTQAAVTELTEGWLRCPTATLGGLEVPAAFEVTSQHQNGVIEGLTFTDATGRTVGGYRADVEGGAPESAEILEVVEVTEIPDYAGAGEETAYLRSLVVETPSGPQLLVDLVSAAEGQDPESLEVWDLGVYDATARDVIYGTVPLETGNDEDALRTAIGSDLHAVLRTMVGSYQPGVQ